MKDRLTRKIIRNFAIIVLACVALSCSTAKISVNMNEFGKVKSIAIVDFDTVGSIPKVIADECTEAFRGHFVDIGKNVVERAKINAILKEVERSQSGVVDHSGEIGRLTGAQALLLGTVTRNAEDVRTVEYIEYVKNPETKETIKVKKTKKMKFFTFQVQVRLVSTSTGSTIMTIKNERPERSYELTDSMTLTRFREYILDQMGKDMKKELGKD